MERLSAVTKALALAQERMTTRLIQLVGNYKLFYPWHFSPKVRGPVWIDRFRRILHCQEQDG